MLRGGRAPGSWARWLGCAVFWLMASPAGAQPQSLAVLGLSSDDDQSLAVALSDALRAEARDSGEYRVSDSRVLLSQMTIAQDCDIVEAPCRGRIARALHAQQVIYGELHRSGDDYEVELHMFASSGEASMARRLIPGGETNPSDLTRHARALLHALQGLPDPEPSAPAAAPSPAVAPDVAPLPDQEAVEASPAYHDEPAPARASDDWIGYTLLGVAGVSLALTVASWAEIAAAGDDQDLTTYRAAVFAVKPSVPDVCDEADANRAYGVSASTLAGTRSACSRGNTFALLQYVFIGAALASAGAGAYFLLDDDGPTQARAAGARFALRPSVSRHGAGLGLRIEL